ncbi:MAG TPA: c-type cytochrome [Thermoanaerobaculia bacterium]|jgi:mono/diheme cytochrome c family protein
MLTALLFVLALPAEPADAQVARGEYLVRNVAVCGGCHSSDLKNPDGPLAGGREFRQWRLGTARASNLTNDDATGLGTWSEDEIVRALRTGVRKDGRLLAPVMPYGWFNRMSDDDARAIARYLKSLPPQSNAVRQHFNLIYKIGKALFLRPKPAISASAPPRAATAEYGAYLSQHAGLCAECHTPRTAIRAEPKMQMLFAGATVKDFPANPSNLTPDEQTGIGRWSEDDFVKAIRTGVTPEGEQLHPFMPWHQNGRMTDDDLRAIYRFLRTVPPRRHEVARK